MDSVPSIASSSAGVNLLLVANLTLRSENSSLVTKIRELESEISKKTKQVHDEQCKLSAREQDLLQQSQALSQSKNKVDTLTGKIALLQTCLTKKLNTVSQLKTDCEQSKTQLKQKETAINNLLIENKNAETKSFQLQKKLEAKFKENTEILRNLNDLKTELKTTTEEYEKGKSELEKVQKELNEQILSNSELREKVTTLNGCLDAHNKALFTTNEALKEQKAALDQVEQEKNQQKLQLERIKKMINSFIENEQEVNVYVHGLESKLAEREMKMAAMVLTNMQLSKQLEINKYMLSSLKSSLKDSAPVESCSTCKLDAKANQNTTLNQMEKIGLTTGKQVAPNERDVQGLKKEIECQREEPNLLNGFPNVNNKRRVGRLQRFEKFRYSESFFEAGDEDGASNDELSKSASDCCEGTPTYPKGDTNIMRASSVGSSDECESGGRLKSDAQSSSPDSELEPTASTDFSDYEKAMPAAQGIQTDINRDGLDKAPEVWFREFSKQYMAEKDLKRPGYKSLCDEKENQNVCTNPVPAGSRKRKNPARNCSVNVLYNLEEFQ